MSIHINVVAKLRKNQEKEKVAPRKPWAPLTPVFIIGTPKSAVRACRKVSGLCVDELPDLTFATGYGLSS